MARVRVVAMLAVLVVGSPSLPASERAHPPVPLPEVLPDGRAPSRMPRVLPPSRSPVDLPEAPLPDIPVPARTRPLRNAG